ncbi:MAG: non-ribosomal peptide synthetase component F, partial [Saprospiraceae bacterium]
MTYLCEILSEASNKFPSNIAIVEVGGKQLTYKDLQEKAVLLKHTLEKQEIGMGHRVGVLSSKRIETVAGIFGISYSGAAYVPMDVEAPVSRNLFILGDCQVNALIIEASVFPEYKDDLLKEYCNVALSTLEGLLFFCRKEPFSLSEQLSKDIAFILYTSGSTGKPKGVMITHQNALSFILWANEVFDLSDQDVFASIAPFHFDLSVFDLYVSFRNGAQLLLIDAKTARNPRMLSTLIDQRKISIWYSTPTLLKLMLQFGKLAHFEHQSLRYVLFAGEVFPIPQLTRIKRAWSNAEFYNLYGPTETNVCTFFKIPKIVSSQNIPFPIGKVCSFAEVKIVDPERKCQEVFEGELWVSGL